MRFLSTLVVVLVLAAAGCATPGADVDPAADAPSSAPAPAVGGIAALRSMLDEAVPAGAPVVLWAQEENDLRGNGALGNPREWSVILRPSPMINETTWAEVNLTRVALPDVQVYEGEVEGEPGSVVRLTVTPEWARGYVRVGDVQNLIRIGLDGNLPFVGDVAGAPTGATAAEGSPATRVWKEAPLTFYDRDGQEEEDCLRPVPPSAKPMVEPLPGPTGAETLVARIILDGDFEYLNQTGRHAFPLMVAFLNEIDGIYQHEVGIRFHLVGLHLHTDAKAMPDPSEADVPAGLGDYWNAREPIARDVVHLFTGKQSSYAQANCIGGAGKPEVAYTFTPLNWAREYLVFHEQAFAHELGHIFSAHHHYGNHVEASWSGRDVGGPVDAKRPQAGLATIMIQGYTPGAKPVFGTLEKTVMRGWAEDHLGKHDAA